MSDSVLWAVVAIDTGVVLWVAWWIRRGTNGGLASLSVRVYELTDLVTAVSGELELLKRRLEAVAAVPVEIRPVRRRDTHARNAHSLIVGIAAFVAELLQQGHLSKTAVAFGVALMVFTRALGAAVRAATQNAEGG